MTTGTPPAPSGRPARWQPVPTQTYVSPWSAPAPDPTIVFSGPGYLSPKVPVSKLAVAAVICGALSIPVVFLAPAAVILGHLGRRATKDNSRTGTTLATAGLALGWVVAAIWGMMLVTGWVLQ